MEKKNTFQYTYSAERQKEIDEIRSKYLPENEDNKMEQLRKLDRSATKKGARLSIAVGLIGCLLLGIGMCCTMVWTNRFFIPGVIIGVAGILAIGAAYPLYVRITKKEREKLAPQILKLIEDLSE